MVKACANRANRIKTYDYTPHTRLFRRVYYSISVFQASIQIIDAMRPVFASRR